MNHRAEQVATENQNRRTSSAAEADRNQASGRNSAGRSSRSKPGSRKGRKAKLFKEGLEGGGRCRARGKGSEFRLSDAWSAGWSQKHGPCQKEAAWGFGDTSADKPAV